MKHPQKTSPLFNVVIGSLMAILASACDGDTESDINKDIENATKNNQSTFIFANATDVMLNIYLNYKASSNNLVSDEYHISSVLSGEYSQPYVYNWNDVLDDNEVAIADSNTLTQEAIFELTLDDNKAYTAIAWLDDTQLSLTVVEAPMQSSDDTFGVRFFSAIEQNLSFSGDVIPDVLVEKGIVSDVISVENCADIATVNNVASNFCQIANIGDSYVVVIMANSDVAVMKE